MNGLGFLSSFTSGSTTNKRSETITNLNVWRTHRIIRNTATPTEENLIHILDYQPTGNFTLFFDQVESGVSLTVPLITGKYER